MSADTQAKMKMRCSVCRRWLAWVLDNSMTGGYWIHRKAIR